jgi:TRAP-type mannitol/chloroaromatic compound transport system substrate-binding protein
MISKILSALILCSLTIFLLGSNIACRSSSPVLNWRMATSWTSDSLFYTGAAKAICDRVNKLSGGRLVIEPYPAGSIAGALEVMDAVSQGRVEMGHSWSGYWLEKDPSFELFSSIPDQMVAQEWLVWMYGPSKGIELWRELYAPYHIIPFAGGLVGPEFGFFTKTPVRTLEDFKGLKLRVSGLASEVLQELGATTVLTAPGDIKSAMQKGEIDGFEFSTPAVDWPMGFQEIAPYVCLPSWHQPSAMFETIVNQSAFEKLPDDLKAIVESASKEISMIDYLADLEGANSASLSKYEQYGTQMTTLDAAAIQRVSDITNRLADQKAAKNPFYARVLASQRAFLEDYRKWEKWGNYQLFPNRSEADKALSQVQQDLENEISLLEKDMAAAAQKISGLGLSGTETRSLLSGIADNRPYIVNVSTVNRNGKLESIEPASFRNFEGEDISHQEHVVRLFRTRQPVLSLNFKTVEGFEAADLAYPVISSNKEMIGSVSVLFKPEILLGYFISKTVAAKKFDIWSMQVDGRIIYDVDTLEIGKNLFVDPLYQSFTELVALGKEISVSPSGTGQYHFFDTGMRTSVGKQARWISLNIHGTEWRLVLIQVISGLK